ncbi:Hpt domain-containing protein [Pseudobdellovibrio exovorus]|uniref:HPt domain-containing protein n=1 Tax=Pseudobdellovibrio exovorus JSS TaxID=1184267 RepID=M4V5X5_9BACT|nr:Hpt domain-containing protein [Pseudobdellovibrio exovorus]AGH94578.1 hypothetical protein A11Q_358 [Pseudobdellovibrio exovorus JSS]
MQVSANSKFNEKVFVEDFLAEHIPKFIASKKEEQQKLLEALKRQDFAFIKKIGHNWKGVCSSYGFRYLSDLGAQIELLAEQQKAEELEPLISSVNGYLDNAQIVVLSESEMDEYLKNQ